MKNKLFNIIVTLLLIIGVSLVMYPTVADYWNSLHMSRAIAGYVEEVHSLDEQDYTQMIKAARDYNETLADRNRQINPDKDAWKLYTSMLSMTDDGIMGYISIPKIRCELPIYHGTDASVLEVGVGHVAWSSLPIGGDGTHTVLSGHRGLPGSRLFTDIDKLEKGDIFTLKILNEILTYEVDQIQTVLPDELNALSIEKDQDYCTLVTCTPYAVNTHRLLVRGYRIENRTEETECVDKSQSRESDTKQLLIIIFIAVFICMSFIYFVRKRKGGINDGE